MHPVTVFIERFRAAVSVLIGPCCPALLESYSCKCAYCCIIGQIKKMMMMMMLTLISYFNVQWRRSRDRATLQCCTVTWPCNIAVLHGRPWRVHHSIMMKVTWQRFDQSAKRLAVGDTTIQSPRVVFAVFLCWCAGWRRRTSKIYRPNALRKYLLKRGFTWERV